MMPKERKETIMMKKLAKRGLSVLAAVLLLLVSSVPAFAEGNTFSYTALAVDGSTTNHSTTIEKDLVMPKDANVPNATFNFTIAPGTAIAATDTSLAVKAGPTASGKPSVSSVTFAPTDSTTNGAADDGITNDANKKYAKKDATIELSGVTFTEPGVYRYTITESGASTNKGITNDSVTTKTLDVYVENEESGSTNSLKIAGYVIYDGTVTTAPKKAATNASATAPTANGAEAQGATKDNKYINTYDTVNLTFSKTVTGNQGSRDKYFAFTVNITGATAGTKYTVDLSNADATPHASDSTTIDGITSKTNPADLTAGSDGTVTQVFYIHHGQSITIKGLAVGTGYTVSEANEEYAASLAVTGDTKTGASGSETNIETGSGKTSAADTNITADTTVAYTNNLEGVIPTGVLLSATAGIVIIAAALIGLILFARRKKEAI